MDLAITYRCNNACAHCYNGRPRNYPELSTQEWYKILDDLWKIGIPHIVFTGGEPTLREDLPDLIRHAEQNGQITGINTNGRRLKDKEYLQSLMWMQVWIMCRLLLNLISPRFMTKWFVTKGPGRKLWPD